MPKPANQTVTKKDLVARIVETMNRAQDEKHAAGDEGTSADDLSRLAPGSPARAERGKGARLTKVLVKDVVEHFLDEIVGELAAGNRLEFREFGVFEVRSRAPRQAQNPRTLERVDVPAKRVVKFKPGRAMRLRVCEEPPRAQVPEGERGSASADSSSNVDHSGERPADRSGDRAGGRAQPKAPPKPPKPANPSSPF